MNNYYLINNSTTQVQEQVSYTPQNRYQFCDDNRPQREKSRAKRQKAYHNTNIIKFVQYTLATPDFANSFKMIQTTRGRKAENGFETVAFFPQNHESEIAWWLNSVCFLKRNYYITKNSYKGNIRRTENMFSLDNIVIDIDNHKSKPEVVDREIERLIYFLDNDYLKVGKFPFYGIVYTGRGVQLWIGLESVYASARLQHRYEQLSKIFCDIIEEVIKENHIQLEVDRSASIRVNGLVKLPETRNMNRRGKNRITYERFPLERYSIQDLLYDYADVDFSYCDLHPDTIMSKKRNITDKPKRAYKVTSNGDYTPYILKRIKFIEKLVSARHGDCEGCREMLLFHYYNSAIQVYDKTNSIDMVKSLNQQFTKPLCSAEVNCAIHSSDKKIYYYTVKKFLAEVGTTEEERKIYDKCTSAREQEREKAIQKKKERNQRIIELHQQGMKQQEIANAVKCCRGTVHNVLKSIIEEEKEERNKKVQELHNQKARQQDIAKKIGCCQRTVAALVKKQAELNKIAGNEEIVKLYKQEVSGQGIADYSKQTVTTIIKFISINNTIVSMDKMQNVQKSP